MRKALLVIGFALAAGRATAQECAGLPVSDGKLALTLGYSRERANMSGGVDMSADVITPLGSVGVVFVPSSSAEVRGYDFPHYLFLRPDGGLIGAETSLHLPAARWACLTIGVFGADLDLIKQHEYYADQRTTSSFGRTINVPFGFSFGRAHTVGVDRAMRINPSASLEYDWISFRPAGSVIYQRDHDWTVGARVGIAYRDLLVGTVAASQLIRSDDADALWHFGLSYIVGLW